MPHPRACASPDSGWRSNGLRPGAEQVRNADSAGSASGTQELSAAFCVPWWTEATACAGRLALSVQGLSAIDVGASTGGFTDCLLQAGAARVCAVDVGYGQLAWSLRSDPRVVVLDRINARTLDPTQLPFVPDLAVCDVSFISQTLILPALCAAVGPGERPIVTLIKPQFEVDKDQVEKGGVVRDPQLHRWCIDRRIQTATELGCSVIWASPRPPSEAPQATKSSCS